MQQWIITFGTTHTILIYVIIVALAIIEGPILSILLGVLLRVGYFSFLPLYICLMVGDLIGDGIWYYLGYYYGRNLIKKIGAHFSITDERISNAEKLFHNHTYKILFISKITSGFGFAVATLATAGIIRIPFGKFITANMAGQFIWSGMLLSVGYFFSHFYLQLHSVLGKISVIGLFILFVLVILGISKQQRELSA